MNPKSATTILLSFFVLLGLLCIPAYAAVESVQPRFALFQKGAPLQIVGARHTLQDFLDEVALTNVSERTIVKAQIGWVVGDMAKPNEAGQPFLGLPFDLELAPGEFETVGRQGATFSSVAEVLEAIGSQNGLVNACVVYVKFQDGGEWSYDLKAHQYVEEEYDEELRRRISPGLLEFLEKKIPKEELDKQLNR